MIVILRPDATEANIQHIVGRAGKLGLKANISRGVERTVIGFIGPEDALRVIPLEVFPGVDQVLQVLAPYKLVSREFKKENTVIKLPFNTTVGGKKITVMAGPCSVESYENMLSIAKMVKAQGATILRGGAFKPRTSPYDFQGLGEEGLRYMRDAARANNLISVSELMDPQEIDLLVEYVDIIQIGARNMQNFSLLKRLGSLKTPIMLKRGLSATYSEFLMAAEYILQGGNSNVMLCERGIRTFETYTRNTLDLAAVPILHELSHLPVIIDPSHGTGIRKVVPPMACAAVAAGADGIMVEVHPEPDKSLSDANQTISPESFEKLMQALRPIGAAVGMRVE